MPGYVPARNAGSSVEAMILEAIRNHEVDHHHPAPGRGKQGVVNSICEISGVEPTALRRGSTVPSSVFDAALEFIGIPDRDGDMPTRAQRIIESVGGSWKPSFASSGSTVTLEGLEAVLAALQEVAASRCTYDADEALRIGSLLPDHPPASAPRPRQPAPRLTVTLEIERIARDPAVVKEVLDRAAGVCEACGDEAPFVREDGKPFLEVHHVLALSDGGSDRPENAVACCPNCHRAFHHASDRVRRKESLYREISALERE